MALVQHAQKIQVPQLATKLEQHEPSYTQVHASAHATRPGSWASSSLRTLSSSPPEPVCACPSAGVRQMAQASQRAPGCLAESGNKNKCCMSLAELGQQTSLEVNGWLGLTNRHKVSEAKHAG
eukprot:1156244-Pelagomonas_calceolata.AAC.9